MPKKRPFTDDNATHLNSVVKEGYSSLLVVRSILSTHFKQTSTTIQSINDLIEAYKAFQKGAAAEIKQQIKKSIDADKTASFVGRKWKAKA